MIVMGRFCQISLCEVATYMCPFSYSLPPQQALKSSSGMVSQFSCSVVSKSATLWAAARQASLSITNFWSLLKLMSIESVMPSNHLILCPPLLLLSSIFPSIRVFSNESALCIRWPKHWSFSFNIRPSSEYSGLISFRMDWLDLLAVQGTESFPTPQLEKHQLFGAQLSL